MPRTRNPRYTAEEARRRWKLRPQQAHMNGYVRWTGRLQRRPHTLTWRLQRAGRLRRVLGLLTERLAHPPDHWTGPRWTACRSLTERLTGQLDAIRRTLR